MYLCLAQPYKYGGTEAAVGKTGLYTPNNVYVSGRMLTHKRPYPGDWEAVRRRTHRSGNIWLSTPLRYLLLSPRARLADQDHLYSFRCFVIRAVSYRIKGSAGDHPTSSEQTVTRSPQAFVRSCTMLRIPTGGIDDFDLFTS